MIVTKFQYPMEKRLLQKIDLMIARCIQKNPKRDAVLLIEGEEGQGKTSMSVALGYYIAEKTGRVFNHTKIFFDLEKMIQHLQTTDNEIVVWDEPALQALTGDTNSRIVKNLTRLLMMARKKRHFIMINMAYFNKFNDYIVWQRPLGMVHVYSKNETQSGRFSYIKKRNLEHLWLEWRRTRRRNYKKYAHRGVRGGFPDIMNPHYKHNVLSDFNIDFYEKEKDKAIREVGKDRKSKNGKSDLKTMKLQAGIAKMPLPRKVKMEILGVSEATIDKWMHLEDDNPELKEFELGVHQNHYENNPYYRQLLTN